VMPLPYFVALLKPNSPMILAELALTKWRRLYIIWFLHPISNSVSMDSKVA